MDNRAGSHLRVFSVNGVKEVMTRLGKEFAAATGDQVQFTFATVGALQEKMAAGDLPDVFIAVAPAIAKAEKQDLIARNAGVEVGRTGIGVAVKEGTPLPDISTPQTFHDALVNAKSLAYSDPRTGAASGVAFAAILARMEIDALVKDKAVLVAGGSVGELVAQGRVELGVQQVTELLPVKGISLLGSLPPELQRVTVYQAAVLRRSEKPQIASSFVAFVTSPKVAHTFAEAGFVRY
jgi:molybdate transport system substrate-binding protein